MNKNIELLIKNAEKEVGYQSDPRVQPNRFNKYAKYLDSLGDIYNGRKDGYNYCDIFVDYMFISTFNKENGMALLYQDYFGLGAGCTYSARYFINNCAFYKTPEKGDQIFFTNDNGKTCYHTGLVYDFDNTYVYTIEGNVDGGKVKKLKHKLNADYIFGYGRPNWSILEGDDEMERYKTIYDVPEYYQGFVKNLIDTHCLAGKSPDNLDITEDMIRGWMVTVNIIRAG